jgi:hypothetical protein
VSANTEQRKLAAIMFTDMRNNVLQLGRYGAGIMSTTIVVVLFEKSISAGVPLTVMVLTCSPKAVGLAVTVIVTIAPGLRLPNTQETVPSR